MAYFTNNKTVNLDILRKSGIYTSKLLDELTNKNYRVITELLNEKQRKNRDFMEPILYAIKNEYGTYKVYQYYGRNLQDNTELARDIVIKEPELIQDTPVSSYKQFILEVAETNPRVVQYMSPNLKSDSAFTEELCELNDKEVTQYVAKECKLPDVIKENVELAGNKTFMMEAIRENASMLEHASDTLKNDYNFMKEACNNNKEIIDYVTNHTEEFGKEGLSATKDALVEVSSDEAMDGFKVELKNINEKTKSPKEPNKGEEKDNSAVELERRQKQLERHIKFFERIKNGEVDPVRAAKLIDKLCKNLDEKYQGQLHQLLKLDEAIIEKQTEEKGKIIEQVDSGITPKDIERVTDEAVKIGDVQQETKIVNLATREEKTRE